MRRITFPSLALQLMPSGKQNRRVISCAVQDVDDVDSLVRLDHTIEDLVVAVAAMSDTETFIARHDEESVRHVRETQTRVPQFLNECHGASRIIKHDVITNGLEVHDGFRQQVNDHPSSSTFA